MNILLNSAPKGQQANSLIMGLLEGNIALKGQKPYISFHAFALTGRRKHTTLTQCVALGWEQVAPSGRITHRLLTQGIALGWGLTGLSGRQY